MIWEWPGVANFWNTVKENLSTILNVSVPFSPSVFIVNELSGIQLNKTQKRVFLAGLTAAKKLVEKKEGYQKYFTIKNLPLTGTVSSHGFSFAFKSLLQAYGVCEK